MAVEALPVVDLSIPDRSIADRPTKVMTTMTGPEAPGPEIPPYLADLRRAESALLAAELSPGPAGRYLAAHLAAMRTAVTVLAVRARPRRTSTGGPADVWQVLARLAPEYGEWASFFAAGRQKWLLVQSGAYTAVTEREADDLLRDAQEFHDLVSRRLANAWRQQRSRRESGSA